MNSRYEQRHQTCGKRRDAMLTSARRKAYYTSMEGSELIISALPLADRQRQ
jgi:hypothetical protein